MKKGWIALLCAVFSFAILFSAIGYAALTTSMTVSARAVSGVQEGVFITEVAVLSGDGTVNSHVGTVLSSTQTLENNASATVSYQLTFYNSDSVAYAYKETLSPTAGEEGYDNANIKYTVSNVTVGQQIAPGAHLTVNVTFSYANSADRADRTLRSVLNFRFVPPSDIVAVRGADQRFEEILNTPTLLDDLLKRMDTVTSVWDPNGRADNSYVGNVVGSTSDDSAVLNQLFTVGEVNYLVMEIEGEEKPVTVLIKREDLDGKATTGDEDGNEMTIYMTAETIGNSPVTVYAAVYTKDNTVSGSEWRQIGQLFEGEADTNRYSGWFGSRDSFNTDTWLSTKEYYSYQANSTIGALVKAAPAQ